MAIIHSLNDLGAVFNFVLLPPIVPEEVKAPKIIFYKPDGTRFEKVATRNDVNVTYDNSSPDTTILDARGSWEYTAQVGFDNTPTPDDVFELLPRIIFWVT